MHENTLNEIQSLELELAKCPSDLTPSDRQKIWFRIKQLESHVCTPGAVIDYGPF